MLRFFKLFIENIHFVVTSSPTILISNDCMGSASTWCKADDNLFWVLLHGKASCAFYLIGSRSLCMPSSTPFKADVSTTSG